MFTDIVKAIIGGDLDERLSDLVGAVKDRQKALAKVTFYGVSVGDTVRFTPAVNPKYLAGIRAKVEKKNQSTLSVRVIEEDRPRLRGRFTGIIRTHTTIVEKV